MNFVLNNANEVLMVLMKAKIFLEKFLKFQKKLLEYRNVEMNFSGYGFRIFPLKIIFECLPRPQIKFRVG